MAKPEILDPQGQGRSLDDGDAAHADVPGLPVLSAVLTA